MASALEALSSICCKLTSACSFLCDFSRNSFNSRSAVSRQDLSSSISSLLSASCEPTLYLRPAMIVARCFLPTRDAPVRAHTRTNIRGEPRFTNVLVDDETTCGAELPTTATVEWLLGLKFAVPLITILSPGNTLDKLTCGFNFCKVTRSKPDCSSKDVIVSPRLKVYHSRPSGTSAPLSISVPPTPCSVDSGLVALSGLALEARASSCPLRCLHRRMHTASLVIAEETPRSINFLFCTEVRVGRKI